jgi:hypothetical protein
MNTCEKKDIYRQNACGISPEPYRGNKNGLPPYLSSEAIYAFIVSRPSVRLTNPNEKNEKKR